LIKAYAQPWSIKTRLALARSLFNQGQLELAQTQLSLIETKPWAQLAIKLRPGLKTDWLTTKDLITGPAKIQAEIDYWQQVLADKPNYRDGLLHLSLLYYQQYQTQTAQDYWQQANQLDPNGDMVQKVGKIVNN